MVKCSGDDMERSRFKSWWIDKKKIKKISLHFIKWKVFRYIYVNNENKIKTFLT